MYHVAAGTGGGLRKGRKRGCVQQLSLCAVSYFLFISNLAIALFFDLVLVGRLLQCVCELRRFQGVDLTCRAKETNSYLQVPDVEGVSDKGRVSFLHNILPAQHNFFKYVGWRGRRPAHRAPHCPPPHREM